MAATSNSGMLHPMQITSTTNQDIFQYLHRIDSSSSNSHSEGCKSGEVGHNKKGFFVGGGYTRNGNSFGSNSSLESVDDIFFDVGTAFPEISDTMRLFQTSLHPKRLRPQSWTICRAPKYLSGIHRHGFEPKLVSIGPFHRKKVQLKDMEEHKEFYLLRVLNSMINQEPCDDELNMRINSKLETLVVAMKKLEGYTQLRYSEEFSFAPGEFVKMMVLDGCFVVELLRLNARSYKESVDDPIFTTRWMLPHLQRDMLLLENQLPFPVIEKLFELTGSGQEEHSLKDLTLKFFNPLLHRPDTLLRNCKVEDRPDHLLGLFRSSFISPTAQARGVVQKKMNLLDHLGSFFSLLLVNKLVSNFSLSSLPEPVNHKEDAVYESVAITVSTEVERRQLIHCVTELIESGIEFRKRENHDLLDIEFRNCKLYIPPLFIDDHTGPVFLNFLAYEQCIRSSKLFFTHYILFFDNLVNRSKDVEHLHYEGIINHVLGSDWNVANLFNKLGKEVIDDAGDCYLSGTMKNVNRHFRTKRYRWWAKWKHDQFNTPWEFASFIGAIILLPLMVV